MPSKLRAIEYDTSYTVRKVRQGGEISWQGQVIYVSQVLAKEPIGFKQISEDRWRINYSVILEPTQAKAVGPKIGLKDQNGRHSNRDAPQGLAPADITAGAKGDRTPSNRLPMGVFDGRGI